MEQMKFSEKAVAKLSTGVEGCQQVGKCCNSEKGDMDMRDMEDDGRGRLGAEQV